MSSSNYRNKYVEEYIRKLMDGGITFNFSSSDAKTNEQRPARYLDDIKRWLDIIIHRQVNMRRNSLDLLIKYLTTYCIYG